MGLTQWYWNMNDRQRALLWAVALVSLIFRGLGLIFIVILGYAHIGRADFNTIPPILWIRNKIGSLGNRQ